MMIGASQSGNNSKKLKNTRFASTTSSANCCEPSTKPSVFIDEYVEYGVINKTQHIPEMKLLKMDYVQQKSSIKHPTCPPPAPPKPLKCKCVASNGCDMSATAAPLKSAMKVTISEPLEKNSKYLIYKQKNHSIFGSAVKGANDHHATGGGSKLQYVSGTQSPQMLNYPPSIEQHTSSPSPSSSSAKSAKDASTKKRYLLFDSKKSSNKFDSIQFYFDNKSYEKYVDNKLYGINRQQQQQTNGPQPRSATPELRHISNDDMKCFENSRSWEYRDHTKTESKLKLFDSSWKLKSATTKSDGGNSSSGASSCCDSEISLKRQNCRLRPELKFSISKSSDDLSSCSKASQDVSRINQLFANATPKQLASKAKFGKFDSDSQKFAKKSPHLTKYHRSTTELSLKPPADALAQSCGFKNCKFSNCPVSSSVASAPISNVNEKRKKFDENFIKKFEDMRKNMKNNEITVNGNHNKSMISVNGKSNIIVNDTKAKQDVFIKSNNEQNKTTIKINESCFVVNHNQCTDGQPSRSNIIELNNSPWSKHIPLKNSNLLLAKVENNNRIRTEENSVKIYVSASPTPSTNLSLSSSSSSSDSDKDYGYFDTSSQGRSSSPEFVEMFKKFQQLCKEKTNPLMGCDGTMFWNNSYFDDEDVDVSKMTKMKSDAAAAAVKAAATLSNEEYACTKCHTTTEDLMSNYICICRNKVQTLSGVMELLLFFSLFNSLISHIW